MTSTYHPVIASHRFGLGPRPGEIDLSRDGREWLLEQLVKPPSQPAMPSSGELMEVFAASRGKQDADARKKVRRALNASYRKQARTRLQGALVTESPFYQRLVYFWANHFAISADKPPAVALAGPLEAEAIAPHVTGYFPDMLRAVSQHVGMLSYLDNWQSFGPNSRIGSRRDRGLNENLAREILELHTLGVAGGYTQSDVQGLANILTGWTVNAGTRRDNGPIGSFRFEPYGHEPGTFTVMGRRYKEDGVRQGERVLADLARHPGTAEHLATKLLRHFVNDEPEPAAIAHVSQVYQRSRGYLPSVYEAMLELDGSWQSTPQKFKAPWDFVVSSLRAVNVDTLPDDKLVQSLALLGQPLYRPGSPAGWPDVAQRWDGPNAIMQRLEWSQAIASRFPASLDIQDLALSQFGPLLDQHLVLAVQRAESVTQAGVLLFMSPQFQRR